MSLTITLPTELEVKIKEAAARNGRDAEEYLIEAIEQALTRPSLDEILAPVRQQFAASGLTEEELSVLVKEERRAMWGEKHREKS